MRDGWGKGRAQARGGVETDPAAGKGGGLGPKTLEREELPTVVSHDLGWHLYSTLHGNREADE